MPTNCHIHHLVLKKILQKKKRNDKRPNLLSSGGEPLDQDISKYYEPNDSEEPDQDKTPFDIKKITLPPINYNGKKNKKTTKQNKKKK